MERDWEQTFRQWSKPSSDTEEEKSERVASMIRAAIRECPTLSQRHIEVIPQGSYHNNTNVRNDSDVDICVRYMDAFFTDFQQAPEAEAVLGFAKSSYTYAQFKDEVGAALVRKFGIRGVTRGKKAFDVHENTCRIDADVVATFEHRRYYRLLYGFDFLSGSQFFPDDGGKIVNWPKQHYDEGVKKNNATRQRFKKITRAIKRLRNEMVDNCVAVAVPIPSFLIECLTYNVPDQGFASESYRDNVLEVLAYTANNTQYDFMCSDWLEVNRCKYLFRPGQPWTRDAAHAFLNAAHQYVQARVTCLPRIT